LNIYSIYSDIEQDFKALKTNAAPLILPKPTPASDPEDMEIEDLFTEDKKPVSMEPATSVLVYDYFEHTSKSKQTVMHGRPQADPMSKGFDIRAFRIKQAHLREREEKAAKRGGGGGGFGQFLSDDNFGVSMPTMDLGKAEGLVID
jgi:hypothetical protein